VTRSAHAHAHAHALALALALALLLPACGKRTPTASTPDGAGAAASAPATVAGATSASVPARDPTLDDLWNRAKASGDADDLARLADREGAPGLRARLADAAWSLTAIRALAYAPEPNAFEALPALARVASEGADAEADAALESVIDLASRPRTAIDREDAAELKEGCDALLALARSPGDGGASSRARRVKSIRALRMLAEWSCVDRAAIPADLDAP
jgi:hypothetical protein